MKRREPFKDFVVEALSLGNERHLEMGFSAQVAAQRATGSAFVVTEGKGRDTGILGNLKI